MKKSLIMFLSICLIVGIMSCAFATATASSVPVGTISASTDMEVQEPEIKVVNCEITGTIKSIDNKSTSVWTTVMLDVDSLDEDVEVRIYNGCQVISQKGAITISFSPRTFELGQKITVMYNDYYEADTPEEEIKYYPTGDEIANIVVAKAIVRNDDDDGVALPHIYNVKEVVEKGMDKDNGHYVDIRVHTGNVIRIYTETMKPSWRSFKEKDEVGYNWKYISPGTKLVIWGNTEHKDVNSKVVAEKASVLTWGSLNETIEFKKDPNTSEYNVTCSWEDNGEKVTTNIGEVERIGTIAYVPLRKVIEALGPNYAIYWSYSTGVVVYHNNVSYQFEHGSRQAGTNLGLAQTSFEDGSVVIRDGVTYVPNSWIYTIFQVLTIGRPL